MDEPKNDGTKNNQSDRYIIRGVYVRQTVYKCARIFTLEIIYLCVRRACAYRAIFLTSAEYIYHTFFSLFVLFRRLGRYSAAESPFTLINMHTLAYVWVYIYVQCLGGWRRRSYTTCTVCVLCSIIYTSERACDVCACVVVCIKYIHM